MQAFIYFLLMYHLLQKHIKFVQKLSKKESEIQVELVKKNENVWGHFSFRKNVK